MAEHSKGGIFTKAQKTLTRTKAKVLQNLGKAGKTSDEKLDEYVHKLDKQQETANKFQKELRTYINAAKAMQNASRSLFATIQETYEEEWEGGSKIHENLQSMELMWADFIQNLQERVQEPMATYTSHIIPLKTRIAKRGRKMVDYDNARHNLDVVQNAKKKDENKIAKAKDDAEQAKMIYTEMNDYLHADLPEFYNSRVSMYGSIFEKLFGTESVFHSELGKLSDDVSDISKHLASENQFSYRPRPISKALSHENTHVVNGENGDHTNGNSGYESSSPVSTPTRPSQPPMLNGHEEDEGHHSSPESPVYQNNMSFQETVPLSPPQIDNKPEEEIVTPPQVESQPPQPVVAEQTTNTQEQKETEETKDTNEEASTSQETPTTKDTSSQEIPDKEPVIDAPDYPPPAVPLNLPPTSDSPVMQMKEEESLPTEEPEPKAGGPEPEAEEAPIYDIVPSPAETKQTEVEDTSKFDDDNLYEVPKSNAPVVEKLPEGTLYMVVTTHSYTKEDEDELSFEKGDVIYVMEYDGTEDLDDGWLMGVKKLTGVKGVFPENFTKREN
ncbi:myc box-dependent-interacting protein 1-like [Mizuhopecten yessoensis]|uniref:Myc box-dependent-interacting protein 1 n=1 Tax=Mizuhopecten yessoensis TaxID=6573 RepID=A0A210PC53_MIZYE|nr:myc box-dependent-interacting protein 1-like [Mizuhopecten yessoensis]OWF34078.1 Myc box-dependent-interacting protein 1 [Mizuhopecten yessoensis]